MEYNNPKSSKIKEFIRVNFLSAPLQKTKHFKDKVLDLGCGWGFYFKINSFAYGIDIDEKCIKYLKSLGHKAVLGNIIKKLPFENNSFKWVVCHDVLEHLEARDVKKIFNEVCRILEKKGHFLIIVPNEKGYKNGIIRKVGHQHFVTSAEVLKLSKNNFVAEKIYNYPFAKIIGKYFTHNKQVFILRKIC